MDVAQEPKSGSTQTELWCFHTLLAGGLALLLMLGLGIWRGLGMPFGAVFVAHIGFHLLAVTFALRFLISALYPCGVYGAVVGVILLVDLCFCIALGSVPIYATDALVHHLAVPRWWAEEGFIFSIPWHEWSFYPMLLSLGYCGLISLNLDWLTPYYHLSFFVVSIGMFSWLVGRTTKTREVSLLAIAIFATLPVFLRLGAEPLVDLGLVAFCILALCYLELALEYAKLHLNTVRSNGFLLLAGGALGLAAGTKLNGALFCVSLIATIPFQREWKRVSAWGLPLLVMALGAAYSPWLLRNFVWTGNPIYPLFKGTLGGVTQVAAGSAPYLPPLLHRHLVYGESWFEIILLPLRIFLYGADGDPRRFDGLSSPFLLLAPLAIWVCRGRSEKGLVALPGGCLYLLLALAISPARVRYLAPIYPIFAAASAHVLCRIATSFGRAGGHVVVSIVLASTIIMQLSYMASRISGAEISYWRGTISASQYRALKIPEYSLIEYIEERLPNSAHVYLVGTSNPFYLFHVDVSSAGYFSMREISDWLLRSNSPQVFYQKLKEKKVTHLLLHTERIREAIVGLSSPEAIAIWNEFSSHYVRGLAESGEYSLWEISPP